MPVGSEADQWSASAVGWLWLQRTRSGWCSSMHLVRRPNCRRGSTAQWPAPTKDHTVSTRWEHHDVACGSTHVRAANTMTARDNTVWKTGSSASVGTSVAHSHVRKGSNAAGPPKSAGRPASFASRLQTRLGSAGKEIQQRAVERRSVDKDQCNRARGAPTVKHVHENPGDRRAMGV